MKAFTRSFSYREILSSLFAALMLVSTGFLCRSLGLFDRGYIVAAVITIIPILLQHRFYLLEHKKRNRILGRLLRNLITALFIFILTATSLKLVDRFYHIGSYSNLMILSIFLVYSAELILSPINLILSRVFKLKLW